MRLFLALFLLSSIGYGGERIAPEKIRALLTVPMTGHRSAQAAWIDLYACDSDHNCKTLITRVPLKDVKFSGAPQIRVNEYDELFVDVDTVPIVKQKFREGWFVPSELCVSTGVPPKCRYTVERDPSAQTLQVNVYAK